MIIISAICLIVIDYQIFMIFIFLEKALFVNDAIHMNVNNGLHKFHLDSKFLWSDD